MSLSRFAKESGMLWKLSAYRQYMRWKNSHTIHAPIVCFWSYVSLAGIQNLRENEICLWKSKCKRASYWESRVYISKPYHVIGSKHAVYFARDKIKGVDVVRGIDHETSLTKKVSKFGDLSRGWSEGSLFNSYHTKV